MSWFKRNKAPMAVKDEKGFTLIELLVVIGIVVILSVVAAAGFLLVTTLKPVA